MRVVPLILSYLPSSDFSEKGVFFILISVHCTLHIANWTIHTLHQVEPVARSIDFGESSGPAASEQPEPESAAQVQPREGRAKKVESRDSSRSSSSLSS